MNRYLNDLNNYLKRNKLKLNKQEQQAILKAYNKALRIKVIWQIK